MPQDEVIVIADNCSDATADIVSAMGICVLERENHAEIGKGYALDFGLKHLELNPPDVVICVDADCQVSLETIDHLAQTAIITKRPVQSLYLFEKSDNQALKQQIIVFATKIRNYIRPLGMSRLRIPCLLLGSGMAFPWSAIKSINVATSNLVEDIKLGLDLAISGHFPTFCPEAVVTSYLPSQEDAAASQKNHWEQGHLNLIKNYVPLLLKEATRQRRIDLVLLAWDLAIPPMALLAIAWFLVMFLSIGIYILKSWTYSLTISVVSGLLLGIAVLGSWMQVGRNDLPMYSLLKIPLYMLWKTTNYLKLIVQPQTKWIRTQRD